MIKHVHKLMHITYIVHLLSMPLTFLGYWQGLLDELLRERLENLHHYLHGRYLDTVSHIHFESVLLHHLHIHLIDVYYLYAYK